MKSRVIKSFVILCVVAFSTAIGFPAETNAAPNADLANDYLQLQAQLHAAQLQIEQSREEAAQAAQRNYLQSLHAEVADKGVYVGMLYVGAIIERSAFHTWTTTPEGAGRNWGPTVKPDDLADLLWNMPASRSRAEVGYPDDILAR